MLKLLLYCCKAKPYLIGFGNEYGSNQFDVSFCKEEHKSDYEYGNKILNGKIVAECDFEVEEIFTQERGDYNYDCFSSPDYLTETLSADELADKSCLTYDDLDDYLGFENGYAIHIKNLHIFDEPIELSKCHYLTLEKGFLRGIKKAPQNMCYALTTRTDKDILISIRPEWLCKILNRQKTIEVRRKVLKEMLNNGK